MTARERAFGDVPVARVMTKRPETIEEGASVADAADAMARGGFRHLPVVDELGSLTGMVSERDLRLRLGTDLARVMDAPADALETPVSEAMTPDPITLGPEAPLREALEVFADDRIGAIPVVEDGDRPIGILSYVDILGWLRGLNGASAKKARRARPRTPKASARPRAKPARRTSRTRAR